MNDHAIAELLSRLENGEISEDGMESDEDDLPYYTTHKELVKDLENYYEENLFEEVPAAEDDEEPPLIQDDAESNIPSPLPGISSQIPVFSMNSTRNLVWKKQSLVFDENNIKFGGSEELTSEVTDLQSPFQFFTYFFTNELLENIIIETTRYAVQKEPARPESVTITDLRKYLGILIFMSVYHYPSTRSFWSNKFGFAPIKEAMTVNKFEKIRKILHFNNNENHLPISHPQHDKLYKLRPIIDHLNQQFSSVTIEQRLSIDEQMCATKIGHFLKQYLPNKPHKWGFKLFVLCNLMGYAYRFQIYAGKEVDDRLPNEPDVGVVGQTVLKLLRMVPRHRNHIVYFDNYYTSLPLMYTLAKEGIHTLGTIQRNRLGKSCKLPTKQDVMKSSVPRGSFDEYTTNFEGVDITTVSWKDNKQVVLASTYVGAQPVENIDRFDKKERKRIPITCPRLIKEYNAHMGGVDLMDSYLGRYRIRMKSRKWYIRIFYHLLDLSVINSWIVYKKVSTQRGALPKNILSLADFRAELADTLCKYAPTASRGRPRTGSPACIADGPAPKLRRGIQCQTLPPLEIRLDKNDHNQIRTDSRGRCMLPSCHLLSIIKCDKCNVHLCSKKSKDCFKVFHNCTNI
ncbi:piggyBac transposable element-derived protein 4-like [Hyposmocoma kahamanoa]|uniref:piggyBac transposable element-derived protein 4-like n=1 Tax=Hyposmocoma kahamanoa TaxID=1477025 RepID=UPI000E6D8460|nr:piggyBac transposable element-derived protein 4-like [Hyposmocoma kahamanoa]